MYTRLKYRHNLERNIRLVAGETTKDGRIELFYDGQWGTMCDDEAGSKEATVACRQLGYK